MENLLLENNFLRSVFEHTSEGILVTDSDGKIMIANRAASLILGLEAKKLKTKNFGKLLPVESRKTWTKLLEKVDTIAQENLITTKLGILEIEVKIIPFDNQSYLLLLRDIFLNKSKRKMLHLRDMALEAAGNGILIADAQRPDLPIIYCNDGFSKMTGYAKEEILDKNCRFLQADDRKQKEIKVVRSALKKGRSCQVVLRNYKKDGTLFWNELNITPVHNASQELCYFIGIQNDITVAKREEQYKDRIKDILEKIARVKPIGEIVKEIIAVIKVNFKHSVPIIRIVDKQQSKWLFLQNGNSANGDIETMAGLVLGTTLKTTNTKSMRWEMENVTDITKLRFKKRFKELAGSNEIRAYWSLPVHSPKKEVVGNLVLFNEQVGKPKTHEKINLEAMTNLMGIALEHNKRREELQEGKRKLIQQAKELEKRVKERTIEVTATVQKLVKANVRLEEQIKETREAENNANQSQAMLSAIAQNLPKGAIVVFNQQYKIVYVEGEELKHINLIKEEVEGKALDDIPFFSNHQVSKIKEDIDQTLKGNRLAFEMGFEKKIYAVNSRPLYNDIDGLPIALFVYNNITQQKKVEREIRYALKREQELSDLKSRFVSMASHEFRTPLSAILSSAILISKQNEPGNEEKREKYVERIRANVKSMVGILNDFLSLDKLEDGKVAPKPQLFDVVKFAKTLIDEMEPNKKEGQNIIFKSEELDLLVFIDPKLMSHVLINLLSNAIKYSEENKNILFTLHNNGPDILIKIVDYGIGIPILEQEYLFERFFRAENVVNIQGTGLGLHIVRQYVELMGGSVWFKSEMGKETVFSVKLPKNLIANEKNTNH